MNESPTETITESKVPAGIPRFPQMGCEHPDLYKEHFVDCHGPNGPYGPARGRAIDKEAAIEGYRALMERHGVTLDDVTFVVWEIIESEERK